MKKTINTALLYRRIFLLIYDIAAVFASSVMALWMRYEFVYKDIDPVFLDSVYSFMPITMLITVVVFEILRLYNSLWAFASVNELQNIVAACGVTAALNGLLSPYTAAQILNASAAITAHIMATTDMSVVNFFKFFSSCSSLL